MFWSLFKKQPKPFNEGFLPNQDGHSVYYAEYGNKNGQPVICFHGGPGSSSKPKHTSSFNLKKYRVILHDQRGCGMSRYENRFYKNETKYLLDDAARLLQHLKINGKVIVHGGSWGSTLALLFAQKYPGRVKRLIVNSVFLATSAERDWMENLSGDLFYPDIIQKIKADANGRALSAYYNALLQGSKKDIAHAMSLYGGYERVMGSTRAELLKPPFDENHIKYAQLFFHYDAANYFIKDNQIINNAKRIAHIPTLIVHNRLDMSCPVKFAHALHRALPKSKLIIVPSRGHGSQALFDTVKEQIAKF